VNHNLETEIRDIIAEIVELDSEEIQPDSNLVQDLGADSMSALELMASLENKYDLVIKPEFLPELNTLENTTKLIQELLAEK
jgi:acyl carrier protein|tara:strand:- start:1933 stop:2178 length:246 start_codon:yes stop_codon:yes gene_type:complete